MNGTPAPHTSPARPEARIVVVVALLVAILALVNAQDYVGTGLALVAAALASGARAERVG
ncbi:MAG TPA: hypothetical protein VKA86_14915 [Candidatus Krumholzibacteria bacterium]|nr:hypothetical protein [Candidatus Krumholzibacteria bacterium]